MHRSGTSAVTRLVNLLGVPTCIEEDLTPAKADNPSGFWESGSLTAFNDRLLEALGCDWSCPVQLEPGWETAAVATDLGHEAGVLFARLFPSDAWVWKDPRNCLTLAFWLRQLDVRPVILLVHRNPLEVAASLEARNGFGRMYSLALWERYVRSCLTAIRGLPVFVTEYDEVVSNPLDWSARVREFLEDAGVVTAAPHEEATLKFVDGRLRHTRLRRHDLQADPVVSEAQRQLDLALGELRGAHHAFSGPSLPDETPSTEHLLAERRRAHAVERRYLELEDFARELAERHVVVDEAMRALDWSADRGEFVPPGHFYSAIPNFVEIEARHKEIFDRDPLDISGIDLRLDDQLALLDELGGFLPDVPFGDEPTDGLRYHFRNDAFAQGDGLFLHLLLRRFRPTAIVEVGSGFSSACMLDTAEQFLDGVRCTFIDPYPGVLDSVLRATDRDGVDLIAQPVQSVPVGVFEQLGRDDLLFVDSTHVSKAGSDVNYLFFEVLPRLQPGVLVHLHDVFPGFEYPIGWLRERRAWSETYVLRAFLQFNETFEIVLWPSLLALVRQSEFARFPKALENTGGSIYLRRVGQ